MAEACFVGGAIALMLVGWLWYWKDRDADGGVLEVPRGD